MSIDQQAGGASPFGPGKIDNDPHRLPGPAIIRAPLHCQVNVIRDIHVSFNPGVANCQQGSLVGGDQGGDAILPDVVVAFQKQVGLFE